MDAGCTLAVVLRGWKIPASQFRVWLLGPPQRCFRVLCSEPATFSPVFWFLQSEGTRCIVLQVLSNPGDSLNSTSLDMSCQEPLSVGFRKPPDRFHPSIKSLSPLGWGRKKHFLCSSHFLDQLSPSSFPRGLSMAPAPSIGSWRNNNQAVVWKGGQDQE